jgi:anti-sigma B factor antagonist
MTDTEETLAETREALAEEPGALPQGPDAFLYESGALSEDSARLSVIIRDLPEVTIVAVGGELDLLTAPQLTAELEPILAADHRHLAIDLTETSFMDSAGIHALVNIGNRASRHFAVICPAGTVRRTIELVGLAEPLCVVDSLDEYKRRRAGS